MAFNRNDVFSGSGGRAIYTFTDASITGSDTTFDFDDKIYNYAKAGSAELMSVYVDYVATADAGVRYPLVEVRHTSNNDIVYAISGNGAHVDIQPSEEKIISYVHGGANSVADVSADVVGEKNYVQAGIGHNIFFGRGDSIRVRVLNPNASDTMEVRLTFAVTPGK